MTITITVPNNNIKERKYAIESLLNMILDVNKVSYTYNAKQDLDYTQLSFLNTDLCFKDSFWNFYPIELSYLSKENLPHPVYGFNRYIIEEDIPIIYGDNSFSEKENFIFCGIDVFASVFFMLTRWEEYVNPARDKHDRFIAKYSVAHQYGFLERPVVNEYGEMIKKMLIAKGFSPRYFKNNVFKFIPTHDIDKMKYESLKSLLGDIIKRKNINLFCKNLVYFFNNPYNTYDFLMSQSEKYGLQSHFYFMASKQNNCYDYNLYIHKPKFKKLIAQIRKRGHICGFHPGYETYKDEKEWSNQYNSLSKEINITIKEGRQHYLMMAVPETLQIWDNHNMNIDSTLGYADHIGFRCGTGNLFRVFNFLSRKELDLYERPLIIMDGTLIQYMKLSVIQAKERVNCLIDVSKKYGMPMTILFHNSSFYDQWKPYEGLYESILSYATN